MKRFLVDYFRFTKSFDVYAFVKLLDNATSLNRSWVRVLAFDDLL